MTADRERFEIIGACHVGQCKAALLKMACGAFAVDTDILEDGLADYAFFGMEIIMKEIMETLQSARNYIDEHECGEIKVDKHVEA